MGIHYTASAAKHGIPEVDAIYAMLNHEGQVDQRGRDARTVKVFVGHPHAQTDRYIEVIATMDGSDVVIFHAMPLSDIYRHLLAPDGA
ncbi:hypothetical protein [Agrococcus lahaulensis]|uniref:hypothetical protein n=1 Tax=Agrococcus lahaulensis TaxID=341722 RepID=UPI00047CA6DD|nr:hypothetical protein [Agrococcus lahaulensis]